MDENIAEKCSPKQDTCLQGSEQQERNVKTAKMRLKAALKIFGPLTLHLIESYSEPQSSTKMKMTDNQWRKLEITNFMLDVFPNESSVKIIRDIKKNTFHWIGLEGIFFLGSRLENNN